MRIAEIRPVSPLGVSQFVSHSQGEKADGHYLQPLIEKTKQRGMKVTEVLADAAYSKGQLTIKRRNNLLNARK